MSERPIRRVLNKTDRALALFLKYQEVTPEMLEPFGRPANLVYRLRRRGCRISDHTVGYSDSRTRLEHYYYVGWKRHECRNSKGIAPLANGTSKTNMQ